MARAHTCAYRPPGLMAATLVKVPGAVSGRLRMPRTLSPGVAIAAPLTRRRFVPRRRRRTVRPSTSTGCHSLLLATASASMASSSRRFRRDSDAERRTTSTTPRSRSGWSTTDTSPRWHPSGTSARATPAPSSRGSSAAAFSVACGRAAMNSRLLGNDGRIPDVDDAVDSPQRLTEELSPPNHPRPGARRPEAGLRPRRVTHRAAGTRTRSSRRR